MTDLIIWSLLATLALLAVFAIPFLIALVLEALPLIFAIVIALWIFSVACG